jgi:predicted nucleic acid-binding protein
VFITPPTTDAIINKASELARAHRLQLWDCLVCAAFAEASAKVLLTEDMQDGRILDGMRLMNAFVAANLKSIDDLLAE